MQRNCDQLHVETDTAATFVFHPAIIMRSENNPENISLTSEESILRSKQVNKNSVMRICKSTADARIRNKRICSIHDKSKITFRKKIIINADPIFFAVAE